jgi:hypothetical protein
MQPVSQTLFSTLALNEFFQDFELLFVASFDSLRIVKYITFVIGEHKCIVDAVLASLVSCLEATEEKYCSY